MRYSIDTQLKNIFCPASPSVVVRGTSRRRIGNLVRLSGKPLSFSRARRMTSLNSPSSSTPRCLHIRSVQSALLMVNRTTPRAPRKASSVATDLPDWYRPPMMVACCCQLAMRCRRVSITGLWMTSSCGLLGSKGSMAFAYMLLWELGQGIVLNWGLRLFLVFQKS